MYYEEFISPFDSLFESILLLIRNTKFLAAIAIISAFLEAMGVLFDVLFLPMSFFTIIAFSLAKALFIFYLGFLAMMQLKREDFNTKKAFNSMSDMSILVFQLFLIEVSLVIVHLFFLYLAVYIVILIVAMASYARAFLSKFSQYSVNSIKKLLKDHFIYFVIWAFIVFLITGFADLPVIMSHSLASISDTFYIILNTIISAITKSLYIISLIYYIYVSKETSKFMREEQKLEERLKKLEELRRSGVISEEAYRRILRSIRKE